MTETQLTLTVEEDVPALLAELAGDEAEIGNYLTSIVRQLHAQRTMGVRDRLLDSDFMQTRLQRVEASVSRVEDRLDQSIIRLRAYKEQLDLFIEASKVQPSTRDNLNGVHGL